MPRITFTFEGHMKTEVEKLYHIKTRIDVDVSDKSGDEVVEMIKSSEYALSFSESLANSLDANIEMDNYEGA
jgi:hypothetical protein